jgi:ABC-type Zn2+ transport system substrate-binding protein/surface adhesin
MWFKGRHIKSILLITLFGLNTVVGSACSLSKVFHQAHHHGSEAAQNHEHADGTNHKHKHSAAHHHKTEKNNDCCSKSSVKFNKLDKSMAQTLVFPLIELPTDLLTDIYYNTLSLLSRKADQPLMSYFRWRPSSTIQDLRIVIQSFQI